MFQGYCCESGIAIFKLPVIFYWLVVVFVQVWLVPVPALVLCRLVLLNKFKKKLIPRNLIFFLINGNFFFFSKFHKKSSKIEWYIEFFWRVLSLIYLIFLILMTTLLSGRPLNCPGWLLFCPRWSLYCPGWPFNCPGWQLYCPAVHFIVLAGYFGAMYY